MSDLKAPAVLHYIDILKSGALSGKKYWFNDQEEVTKAVNELFSLVSRIKPRLGGRVFSLWLRVPRGTIEDYGNFEIANEYNEYASYDDFVEEWQDFFPDETMWVSLDCIDDKPIHFRSILLNHNMVYEDNEREEKRYVYIEAAEFFQWICNAVKNCIAELEDGSYNATVEAGLPKGKRTGLISRKDYWDILPDERMEFFRYFPKSSQDKFFELIKDQSQDYESVGRLPEMTADLFYTACSYGYAANPHEYNIKGMTAKEQYYRFADGRDNGLSEIAIDSSEAFKSWIQDRTHFGGHPYEVMAGGNTTHVSLCVHLDDDGYFFMLEGRSIGRTVETLNFYLALRDHKLPVFLCDKDLFIRRLLETEQIGIVPEDITPKYCDNMFPGNEVKSFMWLPWDEPERSLVAEKCTWLPEPQIQLSRRKK